MLRSESAIYRKAISKVWRRVIVIGTYDGELDVTGANFRADLVDIIDPCLVRFEAVRRETNDLDAAGSKVRSTTSDLSKFSGTDLRNRKW